VKAPNKILIYGKGGVGKSHCTATLFKSLPSGSKVIYLMTERNAAAGLKQGLKFNKLEMEEGDLTFFYPKKREKSFTNLKASLEKFQEQSLAEALKGDAQKTDNKNRYGYFLEIASSLTAFKGEDYASQAEVKLGNVGDLTENDWLVIDGLSVISNEIKKTCLGDKYIAISRNDYQRPQAVLVDFMQDLQSIPCNVILLAHEEIIYEKVMNPRTREEESVEKGAQVALNMGAKIQSTVMGCFSEVIYALSMNGRFTWDTSNNANYARVTKLPAKVGLEPDFSKYPSLFEDL